jgi:hypothetical protein
MAADFDVEVVMEVDNWPKFQGSSMCVVWEENAEIFYFDGVSVIQVTNNNDLDILNDNNRGNVYNKYLVWKGYREGIGQIFMFDGTETIQITNNQYTSCHPIIKQGPGNTVIVVWYEETWDAEYNYRICKTEFKAPGKPE